MTPFSKEACRKYCQLLLLALSGGLLTTGCQTYQQQNKVIVHWRQGDLTNAIVAARVEADKNTTGKDAVIWHLEQGAVLRAAGMYTNSNDAFNLAEEKMDDYARKAKVRVGQEAGALLSNQAQLAYEGRAYDGIMLNTYKALNYLALGEIDKARPELIRAYQRQQDAVEENKKRIERIQNEAANNTNSVAIKKAQDDPKFQSQMQGTNYANLNSLKAYTDYVNPFVVYLDGLYFLANAADASDLERAHKSFERVSAFSPDNEYVKQDLAAADDVIQGKPLAPVTYVIFETGEGPERSQVRVDIPIIVTKVSYVGAAFPTLKLHDGYASSLNVTAEGTNTTTTELVASMDSVVGLDFKNEMPVVITKTIAATVTKAIAAYAVNDAAGQQSALGGLIAQIGTAVYQAAVNIADERTWTTLPKEFQVDRIPTPEDRKIELTTPNGMKTSVAIDSGMVNVVYVKSINARTPLLVSQFKLK